MPSERRLHPSSILFAVGARARELIVPGLLVLIGAGRAGWDWQVWTMLLVIPYTAVALVRYLSFRYRYEPHELVIRTGLLFRNERHVPYARIQNVNATQNVLHRLLGVVEVRVETGGSQEPEATLRVLPVDALEEMRRRVFEGREAQAGGAVALTEPGTRAVADTGERGRVLLKLTARELMVCGLIQNRGLIAIAAGLGLLWELGVLDRIFGSPDGDAAISRTAVREMVRAIVGHVDIAGSRWLAGGILIALLMLITRVISVIWALVRLHDFTLVHDGADLRVRYGLLTRVVTTIPLRRIQTLTVVEGPWHQLLRRASVKVETAGGTGPGDSARDRAWIAPVIPVAALPGFLHDVMPDTDVNEAADLLGKTGTDGWCGVHARAFRRALKPYLFMATVASIPVTALLTWGAPPVIALLMLWASVAARIHVAHLRWAVSSAAVWFRSGWLSRRMTVVRYAKIQVVALRESPFDRRTRMARVAVDTAGAGNASHRVQIPYLGRDIAFELRDVLATRAALTTFKW